MGFEPDFLNDGDTANALSVNSTFNDAQAWIDAINVGGSRRGAFNHRHAGRTVRQQGAFPLHIETDDDGTHRYSRSVFGASMDYTTWNNPGGSDALGNIGTSDRTMIGHASATGGYTGPAARITYGTGFFIGVENGSNVAAVLVMFNCNVRFAFEGNGTGLEIMICLQMHLDAFANWTTISTTERFVSQNDHSFDSTNELMIFDVPIACLIDVAEVEGPLSGGDAAVNKLTGIRAMVSMRGSGTTSYVILEHWNLSALPIFADQI